jgi:hypothetical protein
MLGTRPEQFEVASGKRKCLLYSGVVSPGRRPEMPRSRDYLEFSCVTNLEQNSVPEELKNRLELAALLKPTLG